MPSTINLQNVQIKNGSSWYTMCPFPVGYIYLSSNATSPANIYGGTWSVLNEDRFLRPSNNWGTGGSKTININQIPSHGHNLSGYYYPIITGWGDGLWFSGQSSGNIGVDQRRMGESQGGGAGLLATLPRLLRLVSNSLIFTSWMEVKNNGNVG